MVSARTLKIFMRFVLSVTCRSVRLELLGSLFYLEWESMILLLLLGWSFEHWEGMFLRMFDARTLEILAYSLFLSCLWWGPLMVYGSCHSANKSCNILFFLGFLRGTSWLSLLRTKIFIGSTCTGGNAITTWPPTRERIQHIVNELPELLRVAGRDLLVFAFGDFRVELVNGASGKGHLEGSELVGDDT